MAKIIVGLGNPGVKYVDTRHNIGFMVLDELSTRLRLDFRDKYDGELAVCDLPQGRIYFLKPQTFMNLSGRSVGALASFFKVPPEDILVVHDEMNIDYGVTKLRHGGSAGGHNGLSSVIESLGSDKFPRLKMGVGRGSVGDATGYVLGGFTPVEKKSLEDFIKRGADAVISVIENGMTKTMTEYNK